MERVDAALATLLPLVPGITYFRFCCEDVRCGIELDEIDPEQWALLEVNHPLTHLSPCNAPVDYHLEMKYGFLLWALLKMGPDGPVCMQGHLGLVR